MMMMMMRMKLRAPNHKHTSVQTSSHAMAADPAPHRPPADAARWWFLRDFSQQCLQREDSTMADSVEYINRMARALQVREGTALDVFM